MYYSSQAMPQPKPSPTPPPQVDDNLLVIGTQPEPLLLLEKQKSLAGRHCRSRGTAVEAVRPARSETFLVCAIGVQLGCEHAGRSTHDRRGNQTVLAEGPDSTDWRRPKTALVGCRPRKARRRLGDLLLPQRLDAGDRDDGIQEEREVGSNSPLNEDLCGRRLTSLSGLS